MATLADSLPMITIVGETGSGKTAAAIEVAKKVNGEILCADSRTVYKQMDIGTAKPTKSEQAAVPHHLLDVVEPDEDFNVAMFKQLAQKCIQDIVNRGKMPILVGGTGLYIDSVLYDFQFANASEADTRKRLEQMTDEELTTVLTERNIDISTLNTKNRRHVIRAIERDGHTPRNTTLRENTAVFGITLDREVLRERVVRRVDSMFESGFLQEARALIAQYGPEAEALQTPGYKAAASYLEGRLSLQEAKEAFVSADMQLAKRQRTWFKRNTSIQWFGDPRELVASAVEFVEQFDYNSA